MKGSYKYTGIPVKFYGMVIPSGSFYGFCAGRVFYSSGKLNPDTGKTAIYTPVDGVWKKFSIHSDFTERLNHDWYKIQCTKTAVKRRSEIAERKKDPETYRNYTRMAEVPKPAFDAECKFFCKPASQYVDR